MLSCWLLFAALLKSSVFLSGAQRRLRCKDEAHAARIKALINGSLFPNPVTIPPVPCAVGTYWVAPPRLLPRRCVREEIGYCTCFSRLRGCEEFCEFRLTSSCSTSTVSRNWLFCAHTSITRLCTLSSVCYHSSRVITLSAGGGMKSLVMPLILHH
jgi:hypothetical protein